MKNWLQQLHPLHGTRETFVVAALMGMAISLFLIVFQPFGLNNVPDSAVKILALCGYGIVTFILVVFNGIVLRSLLPRQFVAGEWTLGRELLYHGLINFLTIGIVNFFYSVRVFHFGFQWSLFLFSQMATLSVGLLPFTILVLLKHNRLLHKNVQMATEINHQLAQQDATTSTQAEAKQGEANPAQQLLLFVADGGYDQLEIPVPNLLFVESADNYVKITYTQQNKVTTTMLRQTMKKVAMQCSGYKNLLRCHRSYMVNIDNVREVEGNAQGLKLHMKYDAGFVPVSRSAVAIVKKMLNATG